MSTPRDGQGPTPFSQGPEDDNEYGHPAPPPMSSPYGAPLSNSGSNSGGSAQRQPPRFPSLEGSSSGGGQSSKQAPPPFVSPDDNPVGATIAPHAPVGDSWGKGNETYFLPPQFSYNPDQPLSVPPPPQQPEKPDRKRLFIGAGTAGAVVVIAVGAWIGFALKGNDPTPATSAGPTGNMSSDHRTTPTSDKGSATPAWSAAAASDQNAATPVGSWVVDNKALVRGDATGLHAFDAETGKAQWSYTVPDQGSTICSMSQLAIRKIGIVQYGPKDNCDTVAAIDTDSGKSVWTAQIPGGPTPTMSSGGDVVAGAAGTTVTVWNAADGKKLWDADLGKANPACKLNQTGVKGVYTVLIADCGKGPTILAKDAHSGADLWQAPLPPDGLQGAQITLVQAAFPTIVHVQTPDGAPTPFDRYYTFDDKGKAQPPIEGTGPFGRLDLRSGPQGREIPHVAGNTLVAATAAKDPASGKAPAAGVVAFDLTTAKQLWQGPAMAGGPAAIATVDQNRTTVFAGGDAGTPPKLLAFSTANGSAQPSGTAADLGPNWIGAATAYVVGDRLILVPAAPEKGLSVVAFALK